jgi:hypothetical protein
MGTRDVRTQSDYAQLARAQSVPSLLVLVPSLPVLCPSFRPSLPVPVPSPCLIPTHAQDWLTDRLSELIYRMEALKKNEFELKFIVSNLWSRTNNKEKKGWKVVKNKELKKIDNWKEMEEEQQFGRHGGL